MLINLVRCQSASRWRWQSQPNRSINKRLTSRDDEFCFQLQNFDCEWRAFHFGPHKKSFRINGTRKHKNCLEWVWWLPNGITNSVWHSNLRSQHASNEWLQMCLKDKIKLQWEKPVVLCWRRESILSSLSCPFSFDHSWHSLKVYWMWIWHCHTKSIESSNCKGSYPEEAHREKTNANGEVSYQRRGI